MTVSIVIGHRCASQGAVNVRGVSEWTWNEELAAMISPVLDRLCVPHDIVYRPDMPGGYSALVGELNAAGYALNVELHFNSAGDARATGSETLCYPGSPTGLLLADAIQRRMVATLKLTDRGVKPTKVNGAGAELLVLTRTIAPTVIVEPYFGSNIRDTDTANRYKMALANSIAQGIAETFKGLEG